MRERQPQNRPTAAWRPFRPLALIALAIAAAGCASAVPYRHGDQARRPAIINPAQPQRSGVGPTHTAGLDHPQYGVLKTDRVLTDEYWQNVPDYAQWEYARRDADLSVSYPTVLKATEEWPRPGRREERPFPFRRWKFY